MAQISTYTLTISGEEPPCGEFATYRGARILSASKQGTTIRVKVQEDPEAPACVRVLNIYEDQPESRSVQVGASGPWLTDGGEAAPSA